MEQKSGVIYWFRCQELECNDDYIGESAGTFGERLKNTSKHLHPCVATTGHITTLDNFSFARTIKESIFIRVNNPTLVSIIFLTFGMEFYITPHNSKN